MNEQQRAEGLPELQKRLQAITEHRQAMCLFYVLGWMKGRPGYSDFKEAVESYLEIYLTRELNSERS